MKTATYNIIFLNKKFAILCQKMTFMHRWSF